jgi:hypothetical protein
MIVPVHSKRVVPRSSGCRDVLANGLTEAEWPHRGGAIAALARTAKV